MGQLDGKTAIVTGASSGIGEAIATAFAAEGAKVAVAARRADRLEALARRIGHGAIAVKADVTKEADVLALFKRAHEAFGRLDLLVNNAGIARHKATDETTLADWQEVIDINLTAAFLCSREALKTMKPQKSGRIINIGSVSARRPRMQTIGYAASKFGLEGMTHSLALEGREYGITCSILHPGVTQSNLAGDTVSAASDKIMPVAEVAKIVVLMAALPRDMSFLDATVLPIGMPFLGRA
jgi:NAD(P)-dependent dehydrogenase (short-subunit alcohol dehydrogenase family)